MTRKILNGISFDEMVERSAADASRMPQLQRVYDSTRAPNVLENLHWIGDRKALLEHAALHPREDWNEEDGPVLWYHLPVEEPPYCGTPNDSDWPEADEEQDGLQPGYYTHWQRLPPLPSSAARYP